MSDDATRANTQSFRRLLAKRKVGAEEVADRLRIDTSEEIVLTQDARSPLAGRQLVPETADLFVHADVVTIVGPIRLPSRTVHIFCRVLRAEPDSTGRPAAIHVDGADGTSGVELKSLQAPDGKDGTKSGQAGTGAKQLDTMHGLDGNRGTPGEDGGSITVVCQSVDAGARLLLTALGGDGGNGTDGQSGGKGGAGKGGYSANIDAKRDIFVIENQVQGAQKGGDGGDGGNAGRGGDAGRQGRGGSVLLCVLDGPHDSYRLDHPAGGTQSHGMFTDWRGRTGRFSRRAPSVKVMRDGQPGMEIVIWAHEGMAGTPGRAGAPGKGGAAGKGGKGGTFKGVLADVKKGDADDGVAGVDGNEAGDGVLWGYSLDGRTVETGPFSFSEKVGGRWQYHLGDVPETLAELQQVSQTYLKMEYEKACVHFLAAGNQERKDELDASWATLNWLEALLPPPERAGVPEFTRSLSRSVLSLKGLHQTGCNYFGESAKHVPRRSLKQITGDLKERLELFGRIETAHTELLRRMDAERLADSELQIDHAQVASFRKSLDRSVARMAGRLRALEQEISAASDEVHATREKLDAGLTGFREAIKMSAGVEVEDLLGSLEQMVFTMNSASEALAMGAVQAAKLYNKSRNYVINDYGDSVKKEYVLHRVQSFSGDLGGSEGGWSFAGDGSVDDPEAGVRAILVSEDEFSQLAKSFLDGVPEADIARDLFRDHVNMVRRRGRLLVEYNAAIHALVNIDNDIRQAALLAGAVQTTMAGTLDPDLPVRLFLSTKMFERAKKGCIEEIYRGGRAQTYENLERCDLFGDLLGGRHPNDITRDILDGAYEHLTSAVSAAIETRGLERTPFPAGGARAAGLRVALTPESDARFFDTLGKKGHASIEIRPPGDRSIRENRFAGLADVRIEIARAWIVVDREAGPEDDTMVAVHISQLGKEKIVSRTGEVFAFEHEPVKVTFRYDLAKKVPSYEAIAEASSSGQDAVFHTFDPREGGYATLSPFSRWRIELPPAMNTCLSRDDLKSATKVILEFHGRSLAA